MNKEKFESAVRASGYRIDYIISQIGFKRSTYYSKLTGRTKWKPGEIKILQALLHLSDKEIYEIFYE